MTLVFFLCDRIVDGSMAYSIDCQTFAIFGDWVQGPIVEPSLLLRQSRWSAWHRMQSMAPWGRTSASTWWFTKYDNHSGFCCGHPEAIHFWRRRHGWNGNRSGVGRRTDESASQKLAAIIIGWSRSGSQADCNGDRWCDVLRTVCCGQAWWIGNA